MSALVNGQPCWLDVSVADREIKRGLTDFLTGVFGWEFEEGGPETGYYTMGRLNGAEVCAVGVQDNAQAQWVLYMATDDIEATAADIAAKGGQVFFGPMQVMEAGHLALALDPNGCVFGLWQPNSFAGFAVFGAPNAPCWADNVSADSSAAAEFYTSLFATKLDAMGDGGIIKKGDHWFYSVSSLHPGQISGWSTAIMVTDAQATTAKAESLGAEVLMRNMQVPGGIAGAFKDPAAHSIVMIYQPDHLPE